MNECYIALWAKNALQKLGKPPRHSARYLIQMAAESEARRSSAGKDAKTTGPVARQPENSPGPSLFRRRLRR